VVTSELFSASFRGVSRPGSLLDFPLFKKRSGQDRRCKDLVVGFVLRLKYLDSRPGKLFRLVGPAGIAIQFGQGHPGIRRASHLTQLLLRPKPLVKQFTSLFQIAPRGKHTAQADQRAGEIAFLSNVLLCRERLLEHVRSAGKVSLVGQRESNGLHGLR
jgi:hypothetical protein